MITIDQLEKRVASSAVYAVCGSGSITAGCHRDADVLVLVWAYASGQIEFNEKEIEAKTEEAYQYFEYGTTPLAVKSSKTGPEWAVWDWPLASPSV